MSSSSKSFGPLRTLSWAVYLGCSWTWCIGMFLPVIFVSLFGNVAWLVFAIPNVLGAAAMGWTLAKPGSSEKIVAEHRTACVAFTAITFAFHLFFLYWMTYAGMIPGTYAIVAITIGTMMGFITRWFKGLDHLLGWIVLGISVAVLCRGLQHPVFGVAKPLQPAHIGAALLGLAPVCVFGFLLCPYLDVTFHRARQQTPPEAGKIAFAIGFGVVFLLMIVLTLMYTGDFARDGSLSDRYGSFGPALLISWVAMHISAQAGFTFAVHIQAIPMPRTKDLILWIAAGVMVFLSIFAIRQEMWFTVKQLKIAMLSGELMYHLFMSFYGLVFPAYVWMFIVPIRGKILARSRVSLAVWIGSMALAAPMFWLGFVNQWTLWLIPGVAALMAGRLLIGAKTANVQLSK